MDATSNTAIRESELSLEASPGYLGEAATVAPRLRALVPEAKIAVHSSRSR